MGKASGGQKEEKMKMRKNEHSPKKRKKKDGLKAKGKKMEVKKKNQKSDRFTGCFADFDCVEALV